ncbi:hypothetical protein [Streptomyces alkaliphilus]|uniref:Integral membrane protein n=1 Tax=Streptomyces alkaliphilus TaxID=1472722 RepID=A0A7W3TFL8_9ACTN|nr:hypothetical protein [Streptomyces alkaliphilus]MBB0245933.1 hypothetical protein [Streptomyces alkaliphilus]MQS06083.1 hypothetical protein [Streptomyces alkaliphilus]
MFTPLTIGLGAAALTLALWCGLAALRGEPTKDRHFVGMAVVTALAVIQLAIGLFGLGSGDRPSGDTTAVFVSYLVTVPACVPLVAIVSLGERSRWGSATVAAGALVTAALQLRLHEVWGGGGG